MRRLPVNTVPTWLASGHNRTPLILLHGMGSTASVWLPQLDAFGPSRQVIAWTMPGYGQSPLLPALSWRNLAAALANMLDTLSINKAHILGHSIGGMVAQEFYHHFPCRVASLILSSTSAGFGSADPEWKEAFLRQRTEPLSEFENFAQAAPVMLDHFLGPKTSPFMRHLATLAARPIERESYIDYMRLLVTFDRKTELGNITVPTLLLAGELDDQAPPKGMQRMANWLPNARLHEFQQTKHMANLESPDEFKHVVNDFLTSICTSTCRSAA